MVFTRLEALVVLERAPAHDEVEYLGRFDALREQVAVLAVKGAEQILRREVDAKAHGQLLDQLKAEL